MSEKQQWISWNENIVHPFNNFYEPRIEQDLVNVVKNSDERIRVVGTGRSSADIVAGTETLISLGNYDKVVSVDEDNLRITVQTGMTLEKLLNEIEKFGWCLPSLPDIDDITLGGALATGTHGTGRDAVLLADYMVACTLITANGELMDVDENSEILDAVRVSVGVLGLLSTVTLQCLPLFRMKLTEQPMKDKVWMPKFKRMLEDNDFLRILWLPHTNRGYVIQGNRCADDEVVEPTKGSWLSKYRRSTSVFLYKMTTSLPWLVSPVNKLLYLLFFHSIQKKSGTLYDATVTKSRGSTLELGEWTIPLDKFDLAFAELRTKLHSFSNKAFAHIPMDIRFIKADNTWLSYSYGADTVTVGCVTRNAAHADQYEAFGAIEEVFYKHGGRPHWAKHHGLEQAELSTLYPRWSDFIELRRKMDPDGKFLNCYLTKLFG